jgi:O-antigen/teichoic acid export membrane protein
MYPLRPSHQTASPHRRVTTRTARAFGGIVANYLGAVVTAIAGLILVPIVLRFVGREHYGLWATLGQAFAYLTLLDFGVGGAVVRRTAELRSGDGALGVSRALSTATALFAFLGIVVLTVGLPLRALIPKALHLSANDAALAGSIVTVVVVYAACSFPLRIAMKGLYGAQRLATAQVVSLIENALSPAFAIVLLLAGAGLMALPYGTVAAGLLAAGVAMVALHRAVPGLQIRWRHVSRIEMRQLFRWSWLLWLNALAVVVIYQTDNIVVASYQGLGVAAVYALTSRLPLYAAPLIFVIADSCLPGAVELCAQDRRDRLREVYLRIVRLTAGAAAGAGVVAIWCNGPFVQLWAGRENYGGTLFTVLMATILLYRVHMHAAAVVIISTGRIRGVVFMSIAEAILNLILSLWWVRAYGIVGVAAATLVAGATTSAWYVVGVACGEIRLRMRDYLWAGIGVPAVAAAPAAAVGAALNRMAFIGGWGGLAITGAAMALAYAIAFLFVGVSAVERGEFITSLSRFRRQDALSRDPV